MIKMNLFWGLIFIGIGLLLCLNMLQPMGTFTMKHFWPIFLLIPGIAFELNYFLYRENPKILIPGGTLTFLGLLFFFQTFSDWRYIKLSWPFFPLAPLGGLLQFYFMGHKPKEILVPIGILATVGIFAFTMIFLEFLQGTLWFNYGLPLIFLSIGVMLLLRK